MADVVLGVLAVLAGALLCFRGQLVLRLVFPIWGAFAGFAFAALLLGVEAFAFALVPVAFLSFATANPSEIIRFVMQL